MKSFFLTVLVLFIIIAGYSQVQLKWTREYNYNSSSNDVSTVMTKDAEGYIYVAGGDETSDNEEDVMTIIKYDKDGTQIWKKVFGTGLINWALRPSAIVVDDDYVYITASGVFIENVFTTLKYEKDGDFVWYKRFGGVGDFHHGRATDIAVDPFGNVFVTGFLYTTEDNEDPDFFNYADFLTVKYNADGDFQWVRQFNGASPGNGLSFGLSIATDHIGFVYVTGTGQINGQMDIFTIKYTTGGTLVWTQRYNGAGNNNDAPSKIIVDALNNLYITGYSNEGTGSSVTTLKYNSDGVQQWVKTIAGGAGNAIILDAAGNVYVAGQKNSGGGTDYITVKYVTDGTEVWSKTFDDPLTTSNDIAHDIALDQNNNVYVTGKSGLAINTVRYDNDGTEKWNQRFTPSPLDFGILYQNVSNSYPQAVCIEVDANDNVFVFGTKEPTGSDNGDFITLAYSQCTISIDPVIRVNSESGLCGATVSWGATTSGDCGDIIYLNAADQEFVPGSFLNVGHYHLRAVSQSTGEEALFTIYVEDHELPVISCPTDKTVNTDPGVCHASAASVNAGTAGVTDNCNASVAGVRSDGQPLTANYPVGITTIVWTATDASINTASCSQIITVVDNVPPTISGESASTYVLSPPNHTMRDVTIDYTATDNCAVTATIAVTSNEPINGVGDGDTDPDWIVIDNHHVQLRAERAAGGNGRIYTITITAVDPSGNTSTKTVEVRVPHDIKNPHSGQPFKVGSTVAFNGVFWNKPGTKHSAKWVIDESTTTRASVTEPSGNKNGTVTGSYKFNSAGVYKLQMNITDQDGETFITNTAGDLEAILVIYDPDGGFTYGGGYFNSPAGALSSNPAATGKASYGFTVNYFKNSTFPKGETQFEFKVGQFEFNALNFDYLVINNSMAQIKGTGKITGGQSGIEFIMTVVDGQLDGTGKDKIRMKVFNKNTNEVIYDNQPGASDATLPTQEVGTNSEIVISGSKKNNATTKASMGSAESESRIVEGLDVNVYPNPASSYFTISVNSNDQVEKVIIQVYDQLGRIVERKSNIAIGSIINLGDKYRSGVYFVRVIQGKQRKEIKLVKL